jgi:predicted metal-binding protein
MAKWDEILAGAGVFQHGTVATREVEFSEDVRGMCEANRCGLYGKTWACPPAVGTVGECRERALRYEHMLVFSGKYDLEDSFDFEGMQAGAAAFKDTARRVYNALRERLSLNDCMMLTNGGCGVCAECAYPSPCRRPEAAFASLEGCGIFVSKLAAQAGVNYINGANTVTYFGAVMYNGTA